MSVRPGSFQRFHTVVSDEHQKHVVPVLGLFSNHSAVIHIFTSQLDFTLCYLKMWQCVCGYGLSLPVCVWWGQGEGRVLGKTVVLHIYEGMIYSSGLGCTLQLAKALWASLQKGYTAMKGACILLYGEGQKRQKAKILLPKWFLSCKKNLDLIFLKCYANTQGKHCA